MSVPFHQVKFLGTCKQRWFWSLNPTLCLIHSDAQTMPIVDKLKEALKPGRKDSSTGDDGDLNKLLASSAKKVLLQKIEFEPASKGFSYQLDSLKTKYVILNPRGSEGATSGQRASTEPAQIKRQGKAVDWEMYSLS